MSLRRSILYLHAEANRVPQSVCRQHLRSVAGPLLGSQFQTPRLGQHRCSPQRRKFTAPSASHYDASSNSISRSSSASTAAEPPPPTMYTYDDILKLSESPDVNRILIDVREPSELSQTGRIPTAENIPLKTGSDFAELSASDFEDRFGFPRPKGDQEVIFYCLGGVRSRTAARLARDARFGGRFGDYEGSWQDWVAKGGKTEWG